jgi:phage gpG-like protein
MASLTFDARGMQKLLDRITQIERKLQANGTLKRLLGAILKRQTQDRITTEKAAPDGRPWAPWSESYAATRSGGHSLLVDTGALLSSIRASVTKDGAAVTSALPYSSANQKTRPFMGVSKANNMEIEEFVAHWVGRAI